MSMENMMIGGWTRTVLSRTKDVGRRFRREGEMSPPPLPTALEPAPFVECCGALGNALAEAAKVRLLRSA